MIRKLLDWLYGGSAVLACVFFVAIGACIVLQVATRLLGLHVPGLIDYSTYSMVAATFFGLAYTLKRDAHIRVTLLIGAVGGVGRRALELVCLTIGFAVLAYFSWFAVILALDSWRFGLKDLGLAATPLWIPQSAMALGAIIAAIAFLDELVTTLRGREPSYNLIIKSTDPLGPDGTSGSAVRTDASLRSKRN
ncbi:MAG: TRAP transporter small permease [Devosia sp.]